MLFSTDLEADFWAYYVDDDAVVKKFDAYARLCQLTQHTAVTVGCPSNGCCASSISDLPAPAAQTSADGTACYCLPWPAVLPPLAM